MNNKAFGILSTRQQELFSIGGLNPQTDEHSGEVEVYDEELQGWKSYRDLPGEVLGLQRPDSGCVGEYQDLIIFVGNIIITLDWNSWKTSVLSDVVQSAASKKCSGYIM